MPHYYLKSKDEFTNMAFPFDDVPFRINPNWRWKKTDEKTLLEFQVAQHFLDTKLTANPIIKLTVTFLLHQLITQGDCGCPSSI